MAMDLVQPAVTPSRSCEHCKTKNKKLFELEKENHELKRRYLALKQGTESREYKQTQSQFQKETIKVMEEKKALEYKFLKLKGFHEMLRKEHLETLHDLGKLSFEITTHKIKTEKAQIFQKIFNTKKSFSSIDAQRASGNSPSNENKPETRSEQGLELSIKQQDICQLQNSTDELPSFLQFANKLRSDNDLVELSDLVQVSENEASGPNNGRQERLYIVPVATADKKLASNCASHSVEVEKESMSLRNEHCSSVTAEIRNIYRLLLETIADRLLIGDIAMLKDWANERFAVKTNLSANEVLYQLDQKEVINAFDLSQLRAMFESTLRFDLVYLIDEFTKGDYPSLIKLIYLNKPSRQNRISNPNQNPHSAVLKNNNIPRSPLSPTVFNSDGINAHVLETTAARNENSNMPYVNYDGNKNKKGREFGNSERGNISHADCTDTVDSPRRQCQGTLQSQPSDRLQNHNIQETKWLCSHYKRRSYVKFDCCDKFWPCHRCHNKESTCSRKKVESQNTTTVKCFECEKEQQFGQFCVSCNIKLADFYCGVCKLLTGMEDDPYHCDKCGVCRFHRDRSFHCDICEVCLDIQLHGNHKCLPDYAYDECCFCSEDTFTGCHTLPCSHKVHQKCADEMVQNKLTRCPICGENFDQKLKKKVN